MPDLKDELRQLADEAACQAQPLPVADVIREGDRRRRRVNPRAPELAPGGKPGRRWPGWVTPLAAAAAVIAVAAVVTTVSGVIHDPGPAGNRPGASTVYAVYQSTVGGKNKPLPGAIIPISTATSTPGKPILVRDLNADAEITPDGKTIYAAAGGRLIPISTASGKPGKPIRLPGLSRNSGAGQIAINPRGKTAYVTSFLPSDTMTPLNIATNRPGLPIHLGSWIGGIVFTPDGKTAYVQAGNTVVPINTATSRPGQPVRLGHARGVLLGRGQIAIAPDGKTVYDLVRDTVVPISTVTNRAGKPIRIPSLDVNTGIAITPDGKTLYVGTSARSNSAVVPISTATGTAGKPISTGSRPPEELTFTPDGKTLYAFISQPTGPDGAVVPISTATNRAGKPVPVGQAGGDGIAPDGKTLYAADPSKIVPVNTATNKPGQPIRIRIRTGLPSGVIAP